MSNHLCQDESKKLKIMTRHGKIARLPRQIREQLNRRLDNGEPGVRLVEWLNSLPQAKKTLEKYFEGREINEVNLTEWKNGGHVEWKAQQEMLALTQEFKANSKQLGAVSGSEMTDCLATVVAARYAELLHGWNGEMADESRGKLRALRGLSREVVRLRRSQRELERMEIERKWLSLGEQKTDEGMRRRLYELCEDHDFQDKITPKMTTEERARKIRKILGFRDKEYEAEEQAEDNGKENEETKDEENQEGNASNEAPDNE